MPKARIIAYYLPQFHPIPENDLWWGKGFTEWTNVSKAKPLFKNHQQPKTPADLGFYDLRIPEVREQQAEMARSFGIEGFCYWHYWFGNGKRLLEKPFEDVLRSGKPDLGFSLAWANVSWGGLPYGDKYKRLLIEQTYPGEEDFKKHFYEVLPAFLDERYIKIHKKPIFTIYNPKGLPNPNKFIDLWNKLAQENGLEGIHFIAYQHFDYPYKKFGFDSLTPPSPSHLFNRVKYNVLDRAVNKITGYRLNQLKKGTLKLRNIYTHKQILEASDYSDLDDGLKFFPSCSPNWDHTPRSGNKGQVIIDQKPEYFYNNLENCYKRIENNDPEEKIIFVKAWNEWAEGNYLEPDLSSGTENLEQISKFLNK